jgi:hypothetical protein
MDTRETRLRWNSAKHRSLNPSDEHSRLQILEIQTGHRWKMTGFGEIKFYHLENRCQGPECEECGFSFCIECGFPADPLGCSHTKPHPKRTPLKVRNEVATSPIVAAPA